LLVAEEETAEAQMALDEELARRALPTLRLFRWARPTISLGFRQSAPAWAQEDRLAAHGIDRIERPTGGGIAVHGSDLSCSVTAPREVRLHALMAGVCESLSEAIRAFGVAASWQAEVEQSRRIEYCLTESSPYAIMAGGRKVCGLAIRRYPHSWLVQGSLLLHRLPAVFERVMPPAVWESFVTRAVSLDEVSGRVIEQTELISRIVSGFGLQDDTMIREGCAC